MSLGAVPAVRSIPAPPPAQEVDRRWPDGSEDHCRPVADARPGWLAVTCWTESFPGGRARRPVDAPSPLRLPSRVGSVSGPMVPK
jgi:hypothetical protein